MHAHVHDTNRTSRENRARHWQMSARCTDFRETARPSPGGRPRRCGAQELPARQSIVHGFSPFLVLAEVCRKDSRCCWSRRASVPPERVVESAATALLYSRHSSKLQRRMNLWRKPALKLSPAPTVSTGCTGNEGA